MLYFWGSRRGLNQGGDRFKFVNLRVGRKDTYRIDGVASVVDAETLEEKR